MARDEIIPQADSKPEFDPGILEDVSTFQTYRWREVMTRIQCPVLLITGDPAKAIIAPELAAEASRLWQQGEIAHIAAAGHCIHRDCYDESMRAITDFLRRHCVRVFAENSQLLVS
ncbi:MAG: alpha/beta hydrolase [Anaerolineae bacterium]